MGCGRSRDAGARDAPFPELALDVELEALLAEAVAQGLQSSRAAAETRRRVRDGELEGRDVLQQWREILGFADLPDTAVREVSVRRLAPPPNDGRVRSRSLVANARDDLESDDSDLEGWVASADDVAVRVDSEGDFAPTDVRRLSWLRKLDAAGDLKFENSERPAPTPGAWTTYAVVSCGTFGLGVFDADGPSEPLAGAPRLQAGDEVLGKVPASDADPFLRVRLDDGREGRVPRVRSEDAGGRRVLVAPAIQSPDRPRRRPGVTLASKLEVLRAACASLAVPWEAGHVEVVFPRKQMAAGTLRMIAHSAPRDLRKTWRFNTSDEPGLDAGGLARECLALCAARCFDPHSAHWRFAATDNVTLQIRPRIASGTPLAPEARRHYRAAGRLVAKCLFDGITVPAHLNRPMLRHLLALPVTFDDLEYVDALLYRSCRTLVDHEGADALCLTFSYRDRDGDITVDLCPGGADRDVDDSNKDEYVARLFRFAMLDAISRQLAAFLKGFYEVLPLAALSAAALDAGDLELALCGLADVDVDDWKRHTDYSGGLSEADASVKRFWAYVASLPLEKKAKLLQYVTGTSRVPAGGFRNLQGRDGVTKAFELRLRPGGDRAFPVAHTCFNRLDLPAYSRDGALAGVFDALLAGDVLGFSGD